MPPVTPANKRVYECFLFRFFFLASGRQVLRLGLEGNRRGQSLLGTVLLVDSKGILCNAKRYLLPISIRTKHPPEEPTPIAFMISLQAIL